MPAPLATPAAALRPMATGLAAPAVSAAAARRAARRAAPAALHVRDTCLLGGCLLPTGFMGFRMPADVVQQRRVPD